MVPKVLPEIKTLKAKLERGAQASMSWTWIGKRHKTLTIFVFFGLLMYLLSYFFPLIFIFILSVCSSQVSTSHRAGTTLKCQEEQNIQMQNLFPDYSDAKAIPRTCRAYFTQPGNLIFAKRFWFWFGSNQIVGQSLQKQCKWRVHRQFGTKERKHLNNIWSQ